MMKEMNNMIDLEKELQQDKRDYDSLAIDLFILKFEIAKLLEDMDNEDK